MEQILKKLPIGSKTISQVEKKRGDSHFWSRLMNVKAKFLDYVTFKLQNGEQIRFWQDKWLENTSFSVQYSALYNLVVRRHATVQKS